MEGIVALVTTVPSHRFRYDDDIVDRLNHRYTTILLSVFAVVVTFHQYVGNPITCWVPTEFTGSHTKYANNFCWVKNTYFLPFEEEVPHEHEEDRRREIIYYQWLPFVFLLMALFFFFPSIVWNSFNSKAGVDADNILDTASSFRDTEKMEEKERFLRLITNQFSRFLHNPRTVGGSSGMKNFLSKAGCVCGKRFGNYLIILYGVSKVLYIANVFAQLFILNSVLKTDSNVFGIEVLQKAANDRAFLNDTIFPKVTMCDFFVRKLGNVQRYTVQCVLPVNLYAEKMFVFLWFWMFLILLLCIISLNMWLVNTLVVSRRYKFIESNLVVADRINRDMKLDRKRCLNFVRDYLRPDGVFVLRLVRHNTNGITTSEVIASIWDHWVENIIPAKTLGDEPTGEEEEENGPIRKPPLPPSKPPMFDAGTSEKPRLYPKPTAPQPPAYS